MDKQKIIKAIEDLLDALGEDRTRVGLQETSRRVAEAYAELLSGEDKTAEIALSKTFDVSGDDIVIEKDITFSSTCEHHLMPLRIFRTEEWSDCPSWHGRSRYIRIGCNCRNSLPRRLRTR